VKQCKKKVFFFSIKWNYSSTWSQKADHSQGTKQYSAISSCVDLRCGCLFESVLSLVKNSCILKESIPCVLFVLKKHKNLMKLNYEQKQSRNENLHAILEMNNLPNFLFVPLSLISVFCCSEESL